MMCSRTSCATWTRSSSERSWRSCGRSMRSRIRGMEGYRLGGPGEDEVGDLLEVGRVCGRRGAQGAARGVVTLLRQYPRALQPELADVRALAKALVASLGLAEVGVGAGDIEDVVDDLEQDPDFRREPPPGPQGLVAHPGQQQDADDRRADEPAGLELVQLAQLPGRVAHAGDVEVLAPDHAVDARRRGELGGRGQEALRVARLLGEQVVEGLGVEPVAGQDRDLLAELDVASPAAA